MRGRTPGSPGFSGLRLREAREALGLTILSLADMVGVSRQMLSRYESGEGTPSQEHLDKLATQLAMPREFFFTPPLGSTDDTPVFYRSLSAATETARRKAGQRAKWLHEMTSRLEEYVEFPITSLPSIDSPDRPELITNEMIESAAAAARTHWALPDGPVADMVGTLERAGIVISKFVMETDKLDAFSRWPNDSPRPYALLNADKGTAVRWRFDAAHELGHLLLHRHVPPSALRSAATLSLMEDQAHRFAGAFLLPAESFLEDADITSLEYLRVLKGTWRVSIGAMLMRLIALDVVDQAEGKRLFRSYGMRGWRRLEPLDDELEPEVPQLLASAVRAVGGASALASVMRGRLSLPGRMSEELLGLPSGSTSPRAADVPVRLRDEAGPAGVIPFRRTDA